MDQKRINELKMKITKTVNVLVCVQGGPRACEGTF